MTMELKDFNIGDEFFTGSGKWRVTDIGSRTLIAIKLDHEVDPSWYNGPPYAVAEEVFDELDIKGIVMEEEEL